jgi:hypothetical protein
MPVAFSTWHPLLPTEVERVPACPGVYELANLVRTVLFIGAAQDNLGSELKSILDTPGASLIGRSRLYFRFHATDDAELTQAELLEEYRQRHGGALPPAQSTTPPPPPPRRHLKAV